MASTKIERAIIGVAALGASPAVLAYLDPGTGSMLLQLLIAGILGALFTIKMYWYRFKRFFARLLGKEIAEPEPVTMDESESGARPGAPD